MQLQATISLMISDNKYIDFERNVIFDEKGKTKKTG